MIEAALLPGPRSPLLQDTAGTVAHVYWKGGRLVDTRGNIWTQNGAVPQVPRSGRTPAGAGPFGSPPYYQLGTGNDVLDFAGDYSACIVYGRTAVTNTGIYENGNQLNAGYRIQDNTGSVIFTGDGWAGLKSVTSGTASVIGVNAVCFGRSAGSILLKLNLAAVVTGTPTAPYAAGTTSPATLGFVATLPGASTIIYEAWFSTTAASDALFAAIQQRVKAKANISAW